MSTKMDTIPTPRRVDRLMSATVMRDMDIFGIGNSIVDIMAEVDEEFLKSYNLPKSGTIIADVQHESLFDDIMNKYDIEYTAGGSVQNALRYCQWIVGRNNSIANFVGAVGDDYFGQIIQEKVRGDGLNVKYLKASLGSTTGVCAVLFTKNNGRRTKTCVASLGGCKKLDKQFLTQNFWFCERSRVIVTSGHLIPVSSDIIMHLAKYSHEWGKDFWFNLGSTYVVQKCSNFLTELFQYIDFLFCSADEALAFAQMKGYPTKEIKQVVKMIADEPKASYNNPNIPNAYKGCRVVVVTRRDKPVLLAQSNSKEVKEYPVPQFKDEEIRDTCGAGDALMGGFLAMYIEGHSLDLAVKCGIYCASECIQLMGCQLPKQLKFKANA